MIVILDANFLLSFLHPNLNASEPNSAETRERVTVLIRTLNSQGTKIGIPAPVLSEVLVTMGNDKQRIVTELKNTRFKILPFNESAAIEVAFLTDKDLQSGKKLDQSETKVKVKYDRQIIAIAKVNGIDILYSDDRGLGNTAIANQINVIKTTDLPLPPGQINLELTMPAYAVAGATPDVDDDGQAPDEKSELDAANDDVAKSESQPIAIGNPKETHTSNPAPPG